MRMAGTSRTSAPSSSSAAVSREAWLRARVTSTRRPKSGRWLRRSNHWSLSRSFTTSPTRKMAGGLSPARCTSSAARPTVVTSTRCSGFVPQRMTAAGVSALRPFSMSFCVMRGRFATPMRNTSVSTPVASLSQRMLLPPFVGSSCPVTTANEVATARCVTGMPA